MAHDVIKIRFTPDGEKIERPKWCLVHQLCGDAAALCSGFFAESSASGFEDAERKKVEKGGITCPDCLEIIRNIKAIRL